jgi:hypothetical protein
LPLFQLENIEKALAQITRKMLLFHEILKNAAVREAGQILMTHKIRLILLLSFHKKVGLKTICFTVLPRLSEVFWDNIIEIHIIEN